MPRRRTSTVVLAAAARDVDPVTVSVPLTLHG